MITREEAMKSKLAELESPAELDAGELELVSGGGGIYELLVQCKETDTLRNK